MTVERSKVRRQAGALQGDWLGRELSVSWASLDFCKLVSYRVECGQSCSWE